QQHGYGFGAGGGEQRNDGGGLNAGLGIQRGLHIFGMNIQSRGRDDNLALAADEVELPFLIALSQVARGQPLRFVLLQGAVLPGGARYHIAADENLALVSDADFAARQDLADGSLMSFERVIEGDDGGGFR